MSIKRRGNIRLCGMGRVNRVVRYRAGFISIGWRPKQAVARRRCCWSNKNSVQPHPIPLQTWRGILIDILRNDAGKEPKREKNTHFFGVKTFISKILMFEK
jgi:hypothetical protein